MSVIPWVVAKYTANNPLAVSSPYTRNASVGPIMRKILAAPGSPSPSEKTSTFLIFPISQPKGIAPRKYAIIATIKTSIGMNKPHYTLN